MVKANIGISFRNRTRGRGRTRSRGMKRTRSRGQQRTRSRGQQRSRGRSRGRGRFRSMRGGAVTCQNLINGHTYKNEKYNLCQDGYNIIGTGY